MNFHAWGSQPCKHGEPENPFHLQIMHVWEVSHRTSCSAEQLVRCCFNFLRGFFMFSRKFWINTCRTDSLNIWSCRFATINPILLLSSSNEMKMPFFLKIFAGKKRKNKKETTRVGEKKGVSLSAVHFLYTWDAADLLWNQEKYFGREQG